MKKDPVKSFRLLSECDYYGASCVVARLCELQRIPESFALWKHGWGGLLPMRYPGQFVFDGSENAVVLVHTQQQEEFLRLHGIKKAFAVGMPFCYALGFADNIKRVSNSLLVMPPHASRNVYLKCNEDEYVGQILLLRNCFEHIAICVTDECDRHSLWRHSFESAGFEVLRGAAVNDPTALIRMAILFKKFEAVTSPNLGSHAVYAALSGCRLSIWGHTSDFEFKREDLLDEPYYKRNPEILELTLSEEVQSWRTTIQEMFSVHPSLSVSHLPWAIRESGFTSMVAPRKLAKLLGWSPWNQFCRVTLRRHLLQVRAVLEHPLYCFRKILRAALASQ